MNYLSAIATRPVLRTDLKDPKSGFIPICEIMIAAETETLRVFNNAPEMELHPSSFIVQSTLPEVRGMIAALQQAESYLVKLEAELDASQLKLPL